MFNLSFDKEKHAALGNGSGATSKIPFITLADKTCLLLGWPFYLRLSLLPPRSCLQAVSVMRGAGLRILPAAVKRFGSRMKLVAYNASPPTSLLKQSNHFSGGINLMLPCLATLHRRRSSTTDAFISTLHVYHNSYSRLLGGDIIDDKHLHLAAPQPDSCSPSMVSIQRCAYLRG